MAQREFSVAHAYQYNTTSPINWLKSHVRRHLWLPIMVVLVSIAGPVAYSFTPILVGRAFDIVLAAPQDLGPLLSIALLVLVLRVVQGCISIGRHFFIEMLSQRLQRDVRDELHLSLLGKSQTFHNRQRVGDIMARATNDVNQIGMMINPGFGQVFLALVYVIVAVVSIGSIHFSLLLTPLLFALSFPVALVTFAKVFGPLAGQSRQQFGALNAGLTEAIGGIELIKAYAQEQAEQQRFANNAQLSRNLTVRQGEVQARYLPLLFLAIFYALGLAQGLYLWQTGVLTVGQVIAFMGLFDLLRFPTTLSLFSFIMLQLGIVSAKRILTLITDETELDENKNGIARTLQGAITFEDVSFGYSEQPVLRNISFQASPGQTIAIIGQTGSGKSTLGRLINRTYDVTGGRILEDGTDVREWNMEALRSQISIIEQDVFLFSRSIAENIAFGAGGQATPEQIEQAARLAQAHDFIMSFPNGYDTVVGERGVMLSGGQRQRIAIARAFLTNPRVLILDDSTSAIDSATEDQIQIAMRQVAHGRTTVLITHRPSQIRWADRILLLQRGEIVDQGTHDELFARNDTYRRIFDRYHRASRTNGAQQAVAR